MDTTLILGIIALYFAIVIGISWYTTRHNDNDTHSFYRGNRRSPWWVVAVAMIGTSISGVTYVSVPGMVATSQFSYIQMVLGFIAGYFIVAYVLLPLYYRLGLSSIYVYLEQRYGRSAHTTGAAFFLLSKFLGCAVRIYLTSMVLHLMLFGPLGVPFLTSVFCIMFIVWLYSFRGGVKTLVWTDLLQTICLLAAMVGFIVCISGAMQLSADSLFSTLYHSDLNRVWFFDDPSSKHYFFKQFLGGMFTTIAMTGLDQDMMQKNLSCRSLHEAQKNMVSYGFGFLPVNLLFLSVGILLYIYAGELGMLHTADGATTTNALGASITSVEGAPLKADELFPYLATGINPITGQPFLPVIVSILFVLGLVAAAFSSAGSAITSLTTAVMVDFLPSGTTSDASQISAAKRLRFWVHLINSILMGVMIYIFHLLASGSVINAVYVLASYTYGPLIGLFGFGMFTRRRVRSSWIPVVCLLSPLLCWVLDTHSAAWFNGYTIGYELLLINGLITALGLWAASLRQPSVARDNVASN